MSEKKHYEYEFNFTVEYNIYKNIGNDGSQVRNFTMWKDSVINRYKYIKENEFFFNMLGFLRKKKRKFENIITIQSMLGVPVFILMMSICITIPAVIIGIGQYSDSLRSDINTVKSSLDITYSQYNELKDRVDYFALIGKGSYNIYYIIVITIILCCAVTLYALYNCRNRINFLNDYEEIINELAQENHKKNDNLNMS